MPATRTVIRKSDEICSKCKQRYHATPGPPRDAHGTWVAAPIVFMDKHTQGWYTPVAILWRSTPSEVRAKVDQG